MSKPMIIRDYIDLDGKDYIFSSVTNSTPEWRDWNAVLNDNQEVLKTSKVALRVTTKATFSGQPTNGRLYPFKNVRDSAHTWVDPYGKPHQLFHDDERIPVGRVSGVRFVPYTNDPLKMDDDFVAISGNGEIQVESDIVDLDTIKGVMDKRFLTVSIGQNPSTMKCTICNKDWKNTGVCDHIPNKVYDISKRSQDKQNSNLMLCLLKTGLTDYTELSFVNKPAAKRAIVTGFEFIDAKLEDQESEYTSFKTPLLIDSFSIGDRPFLVIEPKNKEVITISEAKDEDRISFYKNLDKNSIPTEPIASDWVRIEKKESKENIAVQTDNRLLDTKKNKTPSGDNKMTEDSKNKPEANTADSAPATDIKTVPPVETPKEDASLKTLKDENAVLTGKIKTLTEENIALSKQVKDSLSQRVFDLRVTKNLISAEDAKDSEKKKLVLSKLSERSMDSLKDSILDLEAFVTAVQPKVNVVDRGSVTTGDKVLANTTKDEQPTEPKTRPENYADRVRSILNNGDK